MNGSDTGITRFLYDGNDLVAEYNSSGTLLRRYMFGPGADQPILWDEGSAMDCSGTHVYQADERGSIIASANCSGNLTHVYRYDEYGIPQSWDGSALIAANGARFGYTGQVWLPELGMYYYKARMYSPTLGRFMQTDPIGYGDGMNMYRYAHNDPVNGVDPSGLCWPADDILCAEITDDRPRNDEPDAVDLGGGFAYDPAPNTVPPEPPGAFCANPGMLGLTPQQVASACTQLSLPPASQQQPAPPQNERRPLLNCAGNDSYWSRLAHRAENAGLAADGIAIGAGVAAGLSAPTGIGAAIFGGVAVGAAIGGRIATGVAVFANLAAGNKQAAAADALGFAAGSLAGRGYLAAQRISGDAANEANAFGARLTGTGVGDVVGQGVCR